METPFKPKLQKKYRRMPCKARAVPADHTSDNAYFDIPPNVKHGQNLVCSHTECASNGGRFKFCVVCDIPVAKRNFARRHSHGLLSQSSSVSSVENQPYTTTKCASHPCFQSQSTTQLEADTGKQSYSFRNCANSSIATSDVSAHQGPPISYNVTSGQHDSKSGDWAEPLPLFQHHGQKTGSVKSLFQQTKKESEEQDAIGFRKRQREQITSGGSDRMEPNYKSTGQEELEGKSNRQGADVTVMHLTRWERDWNSLLYSRPNTSDREKVQEWMEDVLRQSEPFADEASESNDLETQQQPPIDESISQELPPSVTIINDTSILPDGPEGVESGQTDRSMSSRSSFSEVLSSLEVSGDEQRTKTPKAA